MSLPLLGRTGRGTIPSGVLCPISWRGRCVSDDLAREHEVTDGEANRGKRKGQSVCSDSAKKGCILDVGLLFGGRVALHSASRAGDGIPRPAARAGEPAYPCLHRMGGVGRSYAKWRLGSSRIK